MEEFVNYRSAFFFSFLISLSFLRLSVISSTEAKHEGFSIELIHRDSPKSPFYNPNETPNQRLRNAFRRSINRLNRFDLNFVSSDATQADIIPNSGGYLMKVSIGSPPVEILGVADTGSDLIWTQCSPCLQCFQQDAPLFDPGRSSTYKDIPCLSTQCSSLGKTSCSLLGGKCQYSATYGDRSYSYGNLAIDTVTLSSTTGQSVPFSETIFGCGRANGGTFNRKTTGIVGLGGGSASLITQIGTSTAGKFSYCLVPFFSENSISSKINFGSNGIVSGPGVVSTPLAAKDPKTFYFLTLEAISVGDKRIVFGGSSFGNSEGNIIIDSGTTLTILPEEFNSELLSAVSSFINAEPVQDPDQDFDLCYAAGSVSQVPEITIHLTGADVKLSRSNVILSDGEIACFIFKGSNGAAIYGNVMQGNFLIGYDTEKQTVSFKPTDCTKE
ncbi:aspartic proteinase CDR1-like [Melia azedarach]|uniref:Aspartic proteinase CDR1-like n=1 Tax=Melia azedarach TaxID=155640 RepID=A0ACC1YCS7_MELAZ|nr:aspartic proteinase CDR1-like [Melia azedarach]